MISMAIAADTAIHHGSGPSVALLLSSLNFLILVVILFFLLKRPVRDFLNTRASQIRVAIDESHRAYQTIKTKNDELTTRLNALEVEKQKMIDSFRQEGEEERKRIILKAKEMVEKLEEDSAKVADNEVKRAREELRGLTTTLARDMAKEILSKDLSEDDEGRLNEGFIGRFEKLN